MAKREEVEFVFRVASPKVAYGAFKLAKGAANESLEVDCMGICLAPAKFAGRDMDIRITGYDRPPPDKDSTPPVIAEIFANARVMSADVTVSTADCWRLTEALHTGLLTLLTVFTTPLFRSQAEGTTFFFEGPRSDTAAKFESQHDW